MERVNRTLQDRLVKELAMALTAAGVGIKDLATANAFLEKTFLKAFNEEFSRTPASGINMHHQVPAQVKLGEVLCHQESRVVGQDWCVQYASRILQIDKQHASLALANRRIVVLAQPGATLKLRYRGQALVFRELALRPHKMPVGKVPLASRTFSSTPWRPGPNHPWNTTPACSKRTIKTST